MYEQYFGLYESPFSMTPDPRFLFFSGRHQEAFGHLLFGIKERKGFIQITGEVGTGKTTLCRALLEALDPGYRTALIFNPSMSAPQLLQAIVEEFGLRSETVDKVSLLEVLNRFLLRQVDSSQDAVLVIDEAQNLSPELMEQVRMLSNLETDRQKLLQIVLMGQPELREILDERELRQLRQRITVRYHLTPLDYPETEMYISHRLRVAGANGRPTFSRGALRRIYRYSGGVPRLINAVCDKALLCGYVEGEDHLTSRHLRRAIRELEGKPA